MSQWAYWLGALAAIIVVMLVAAAIWRPVVLRLAIRNPRRRAGESGLIVVGVALASGLLIGGLVTGDSVSATVETLAEYRLGPVDIEFVFTGATAERQARRVQDAISQTAEGSLVRRTIQTTVGTPGTGSAGDTGSTGGLTLAEPSANVYDMDFDEAFRFAGETGTGLPVAAPSSGTAIVSEVLAGRLSLGEGDVLVVVVDGRLEPFKIVQIVPARSIAGFTGAFDREPLAVWIPTGSLTGSRPRVELLVDLPGTATEATAGGEMFIAGLAPVLSLPGESKPSASLARAELSSITDLTSKAMRTQLLALGSFATLAAVVLVVAIFLMTMFERRREIGVLRAVGGGTVSIAASAGQEAFGLALLGTLVGVAVGVLIALMTVVITASALRTLLPGIATRVDVRPASLVIGISAGLVAAVLTAVVSTRRWTSMEPAHVLSDRAGDSRPVRIPTLIGGLAFLALGIATSWTDLRHGTATFAYLGPPIALLGLVMILWQTRWAYLATLIAGLAAFLWIVGLDIRWGGRLATSGLPLLVGAGVTMVAGLGAAAGIFAPIAGRLGVRILDRARIRSVAARLAAAGTGASRGQAGFIVGVCSLVVMIPVAVAGVSAMERADIARVVEEISGGWGLRTEIRSSASPDRPTAADRLSSGPFAGEFEHVVDLPSGRMRAHLIGAGDASVVAYGVVPSVGLAELEPGGNRSGGMLPLVARDQEFSSDAEAWQALYAPHADGRGRVIVTLGSLPRGVDLRGAFIRVGDSDQVLRIAGISAMNEYLPGVFADPAILGKVGVKLDHSNALGVPRQGVDTARLTLEVQGYYAADGCRVLGATRVVERRVGVRSVVSRVLQAFLSIGLIVGAGAVGVVMSRSVRMRRREIAVLRALGERRVGAAFNVLLQSLVLSGAGVILGTFIGAFIGNRVFMAASAGRPGVMPWFAVAATGGLAFVLISIGAIVPAVSASRRSPAEGLSRSM